MDISQASNFVLKVLRLAVFFKLSGKMWQIWHPRMKRLQSHDTLNPQQIWERENYVSDYTDFHPPPRRPPPPPNSSVIIGGSRPLLAWFISMAQSWRFLLWIDSCPFLAVPQTMSYQNKLYAGNIQVIYLFYYG